ncbi:MAG: hypothetical protein LBT49_05220 [Prevotellaceae bacterium]|jgi:hypothetical protein|nr:hypothetical protein [Prevotellaceae bacterium]
METIIAILKGTQGVFLSATKETVIDDIPVSYVDIAHDKQNLRGDMVRLFSDFRKATEEAKMNISK